MARIEDVAKVEPKKTAQVRVRLTPAQKRRFVRAAEQRGLSLSSWLVSVALERS